MRYSISYEQNGLSFISHFDSLLNAEKAARMFADYYGLAVEVQELVSGSFCEATGYFSGEVHLLSIVR